YLLYILVPDLVRRRVRKSGFREHVFDQLRADELYQARLVLSEGEKTMNAPFFEPVSEHLERTLDQVSRISWTQRPDALRASEMHESLIRDTVEATNVVEARKNGPKSPVCLLLQMAQGSHRGKVLLRVGGDERVALVEQE